MYRTDLYKIIAIVSGLLVIIITPNLNKDAVIVPKFILLFLLSLYLLPKIVKDYKYFNKITVFKLLMIICALIIIQMSIVIIVSEAPIEQQLFGKVGRGLGFFTAFSLVVITIASSWYANRENLKFFLKIIIVSISLSSLYSILQSYGIDFIRWETRTNGVIGTLGNPNFQSTAAAMILVPCLLFFRENIYSQILTLFLVGLNLFVIVRTSSVQGLIGSTVALSLLLMIYVWYKSRFIFLLTSLMFFMGGLVVTLAMLNMGPLRSVTIGQFSLYKVSVQSRGDFWRSAFATSSDNPVFGVGIDSFGDYFLKYRDEIAISHPWAEFTDNAHNFFLEYAATGGYPLMIFHIFLIGLTAISAIKFLKNSRKFDKDYTSIFILWIVFQAHSVISPGSIPLLLLNAVSTGTLIGLTQKINTKSRNEVLINPILKLNSSMSIVLLGIIAIFPYFNSDRIHLKALNSGNIELLMENAKSFPQSTLKYSNVSRILLESNRFEESLIIARLATEYNRNSAPPWAHILLNPLSSKSEKIAAKAELIKLDPKNQDIKDIKI